ncbi:hypothetical protein P2G88_03030 [Aliiglaciecola sp. CAU 1673]|uniref:hypothetical protein n=1 Tax=Aliiglaciecola sp. CAU 1673 TaxID=3032595 RepID=UPI0023DC0198|nr:hypothetical protein [Aliiglaciecola sp. CAU 1673]MDF2177214.1 hypothetical protein [Aliiglaciecola sp. CAU 1673]
MRALRALMMTLLVILTSLVMGCSKQESEGVGKYGMMDDGTPEYAAIQFFNHLYHDQDMEEVLRLSSPKMSRLVRNYHTNSNFQRHVMNLSYDKVELAVDSGNNNVRGQYSDEATVIIFFTGTFHGKKKEDLRTTRLKNINGQWKVHEIEVDKF